MCEHVIARSDYLETQNSQNLQKEAEILDQIRLVLGLPVHGKDTHYLMMMLTSINTFVANVESFFDCFDWIPI